MSKAIRRSLKVKLFVAGGILFLLFVLFNESFRATLARQSEIRERKKELEVISAEVQRVREKIAHIKNNPSAYEQLTREELGYLRPGEKEIRFIKKNSK